MYSIAWLCTFLLLLRSHSTPLSSFVFYSFSFACDSNHGKGWRIGIHKQFTTSKSINISPNILFHGFVYYTHCSIVTEKDCVKVFNYLKLLRSYGSTFFRMCLSCFPSEHGDMWIWEGFLQWLTPVKTFSSMLSCGCAHYSYFHSRIQKDYVSSFLLLILCSCEWIFLKIVAQPFLNKWMAYEAKPLLTYCNFNLRLYIYLIPYLLLLFLPTLPGSATH